MLNDVSGCAPEALHHAHPLSTVISVIELKIKPVSLHNDKHVIFRVYGPEKRNTTESQFGRVLYDLPIELFCAKSFKAKGRV